MSPRDWAKDWGITTPRALVAALLFVAGWCGGTVQSPGERITTLEAQFAEHVTWAEQERGTILDRVDALVRVACVERMGDPLGRQLLLAAKVPCPEVLGNNMPDRRAP